MTAKRNDPAAVGAVRAGKIVSFGNDPDYPESMAFRHDSPAVRHLLRRYPLTPDRARLIADMIGMGGGHA